MSNELTTQPGKAMFDPQLWSAWRTMADTFVKSKALPATIDNAEKVILVLQAAHDFGMTVSEALKGFYFVNGQMTVWGEVAIAQMTKKGYKVEWGTCNDKTATCVITAPDGRTASETYTIEEANKAGLSSKGMWVKYPKNMLRFKAFGLCKRFSFPEIMSGVYTKEDFEGEVIDVQEVGAKPSTINAILAVQKEKRLGLKWFREKFGVQSRDLLEAGKKTENTILTESDARAILKELNAYTPKEEDSQEDVEHPKEPQKEAIDGTFSDAAEPEAPPAAPEVEHPKNEDGVTEEEENKIKIQELRSALADVPKESDEYKKMTTEINRLEGTQPTLI